MEDYFGTQRRNTEEAGHRERTVGPSGKQTPRYGATAPLARTRGHLVACGTDVEEKEAGQLLIF